MMHLPTVEFSNIFYSTKSRQHLKILQSCELEPLRLSDRRTPGHAQGDVSGPRRGFWDLWFLLDRGLLSEVNSLILLCFGNYLAFIYALIYAPSFYILLLFFNHNYKMIFDKQNHHSSFAQESF